jgi:hypothetical protein
MGMVEKKGVNVTLILLRDVDLQKGFDLGTQAAAKFDGVFNGFNVFTFGGSPQRDKQTMNIFVDSTHIGEVVTTITKGLDLAQADYMFQASPTVQYVNRGPPTQTTA